MPNHNPNAGGETPVILHIGIGSFHRTHQARYLNRLREAGQTDWSIAAATIRSDMVPLLECLTNQNGSYTLETVTPDGVRAYERIDAIRRLVPWDVELAALVDEGAQPATRIISFTVTEAGYYLDEHDRLDLTNPDLAADLSGARRTIYGALCAILAERVARDAGPVTLLCCDNLRNNGGRFRGGLLEFLERRGEHDVLRYALERTTSPNSMVDGIAPRPNADVATRVRDATGFDDGCPVIAESYVQWVMEDDFCAGRPPWELAGAEFAQSVLSYEEAKLRILNAGHSCIAWAGTLAGFTYIHEGARDEAIRGMAYDYITDDVIPCLTPSPIDLPAYRDTVLERFGNPYIRDTNQRVSDESFSKVVGFILPTLIDRVGKAPFASTAMLPALYYLFLERWHRGELPNRYQDSLLDMAATHAIFDGADSLHAFCADGRLWAGLAGNAKLEASIRAAVERARAWLASREVTQGAHA